MLTTEQDMHTYIGWCISTSNSNIKQSFNLQKPYTSYPHISSQCVSAGTPSSPLITSLYVKKFIALLTATNWEGKDSNTVTLSKLIEYNPYTTQQCHSKLNVGDSNRQLNWRPLYHYIYIYIYIYIYSRTSIIQTPLCHVNVKGVQINEFVQVSELSDKIHYLAS